MPKLNKVLLGSALLVAASPSFAAGGIDSYFAAIDISAVGTAVAGIGVAIIAVTMSIKGISLAKRVISKV